MISSASIENSVIDPDNAESRAHWARTFKVSEDELLQAIGVIGVIGTAPAALEFYLRPGKPRIQRGYSRGASRKNCVRARPRRRSDRDEIMWVSARTPDDAPLFERRYEKLYRIIDARVDIRQPYLAHSCWNALEAGGTLPAVSRRHTLLDKGSVDLIEATATRILAEGEQGFPLRRGA